MYWNLTITDTQTFHLPNSNMFNPYRKPLKLFKHVVFLDLFVFVFVYFNKALLLYHMVHVCCSINMFLLCEFNSYTYSYNQVLLLTWMFLLGKNCSGVHCWNQPRPKKDPV